MYISKPQSCHGNENNGQTPRPVIRVAKEISQKLYGTSPLLPIYLCDSLSTIFSSLPKLIILFKATLAIQLEISQICDFRFHT